MPDTRSGGKSRTSSIAPSSRSSASTKLHLHCWRCNFIVDPESRVAHLAVLAFANPSEWITTCPEKGHFIEVYLCALLIYDHFVYQIDQKKDFKPELLTASSMIIRNFVEDYHEKQEEQFLFPRFEQANVLTDLVTVLKTQHQAGRRLTDRVMTLAKSSSAGDKNEIAQSLRQFVRMYRPHEAREDTVLFPELRKIVSPHEFDALGEHFEDNEHKQFGADGFELYRDKVADIEKQLGIYDLSHCTPKA